LGHKITKKIGKIGKILLWAVIIFITLDFLIVGALFIKPIQNALVDKVTKSLSDKWKSEISIQNIYLTPTFQLEVYGFVIKDYRHNDMIRVDYAKTRFKRLKLSPMYLHFGTIVGEGGEVVVRQYKGDERVNIALWADNFKKKETRFLLKADRLRLDGVEFRYENDEKRLYQKNSDIDYAFFVLSDIHFDCLHFTVNRADISAKINRLGFNQYTGFELLNASGDFRINEHQLTLNNALVVTHKSHVFMDLAFQYSDWSSLGEFVDSVNLQVDVRPSTLNTEDVAYFVPSLKGMTNSVILKGKVKGPVNDINLQSLHVNYGNSTFVEGDFYLQNITDMRKLNMDLDIRNSNFNFSELAMIGLPGKKQMPIPKSLLPMTNCNLTGDFSGRLTQFSTALNINSTFGSALVDFSVSDSTGELAYSGEIGVPQLNLGKLINQEPILGHLSMETEIIGKAQMPFDNKDFFTSIEAVVTGRVNKIQLKEYMLQNVDFKGVYADRKYRATVDSKDTNICFSLDGNVDLTGQLPNYIASLSISDLAAGKIAAQFKTVDSLTAQGFDKVIYFAQKYPDLHLSVNSLKINGNASNIDNLTGALMLDSLSYLQDGKVFRTKALRFIALNTEGVRKYRLTSDIVNASMSTTYPISKLLDTLSELAYRYVPNLMPEKKTSEGEKLSAHLENASDQYLSFQLETFQTRQLLAFFTPGLAIAPASIIFFYINSQHDRDSIDVRARYVRLNPKMRISNLRLNGKEMDNQTFSLTCTVDSFNLPVNDNTFSFKNINLNAAVECNRVQYDLNWKNPESVSLLPSQLSGMVQFSSLSHYILQFYNESELAIKNYRWHFNDQNQIQIKKDRIEFDNLLLSADKSSLKLDGTFSQKENLPLKIDVTNVDLSILNSFFDNKSINLGGDISSEFNFSVEKGKKILNGKALISDFVFNETKFGNIFVLATLPTQNDVRFVGGIYTSENSINSSDITNYSYASFEKEKGKIALLNGGYDIKNKQFAVYTNVSSLEVGFLEPFLSSFSHYVNGDASAELAFIAKPDTFYFDGKVLLKKAELGIAPLNTVYKIENQKIEFNQKGLEFNKIVLKDKYENQAILNGYVHHNKFKNMKLNLTIESDRILVLNTAKSLDMPFYGDGFVKGKILISGDEKKLKFSGNNIVTGKGTNFFLPLYFSESTSESDVIVFKAPPNVEKSLQNPKEQQNAMEMEFDFNVDITPNAMVQIELDPSIGGTLQARVEGPLRFMYSTSSDMSLTGTLALQSGSFHLTLKDIIDKKLTLTPGGTINFVGPIDLATVNLSGVYKTNASLNEIISQDIAGATNLRRTPVNAYIHLIGSLFNPSIDFSFELPNSSNDISTLFYSAIDTTVAENRTRQFFSLLVLGKFESSEQNTTNMVASAVEYSGVELLTNTINNFISQNLKYVDIGLKYRNADETHAEEYSVSASTSLFNDRIIIEGSFGYTNDKTNNFDNGTNFIGDYSIEYALNESKNWRVKVFNVTNQFSSLTQSSPYAQGVAVIFKKEFNNKKDFLESWKSPSKKKVIRSNVKSTKSTLKD